MHQIFDPNQNGGRIPCDCDMDEDDCKKCCPADRDDWPCIYMKGHPGKHCDIQAIEWS